jgi:hypothetical protein
LIEGDEFSVIEFIAVELNNKTKLCFNKQTAKQLILN